MTSPALLLVLPGLAAVGLAAGAALWWWSRHRDGVEVLLRDLEFVAIDTETTGLDPRSDALVSIAAVPFVDGQPRWEAACDRLVNPGRLIPAAVQAIHGIRDADVLDAPPAAEVLPEFLEVCRGHPVVAHTADFDLAFINRAAGQAGIPGTRNPVLDIGVLAHGILPSWWDLSLEGLARLTEVEPVGRHRASGDALTAGVIFLRLIPLLEQHGIVTLSAALRFQRRVALIPSGPGATGGGLAGP